MASTDDEGRARPILRRSARVVVAATILAVVVWRLGTGPFADGVESLDLRAIGAAVALTLACTLAAAWRWTVVSAGLGVGLPFRRAVAAYYRSQFLNATLPGGVLGDVHRGYRYGRRARDVSGGLRAVGWERGLGQLVQAIATVVVLATIDSPVRRLVPLIGGVIAVLLVVAVIAGHLLPRARASRLSRGLRSLRTDARWIHNRHVWPVVLASSSIVVAGHLATFVVAARITGIDASLHTLVPLGMVILLAAAIPTNLAGWGPREGAAASVFAAAHLGTSHGVAAATAFGVLTLLAVSPGAAVLAVNAFRSRRRPAGISSAAAEVSAVPATGRREELVGG
jgi:uncharacterized membrane protein YbhN (UPF0104 family)